MPRALFSINVFAINDAIPVPNIPQSPLNSSSATLQRFDLDEASLCSTIHPKEGPGGAEEGGKGVRGWETLPDFAKPAGRAQWLPVLLRVMLASIPAASHPAEAALLLGDLVGTFSPPLSSSSCSIKNSCLFFCQPHV